MARRKFNNCLNSEPTAFNVPVGSLIGCGTAALGFGIAYGLLAAFAGGGFGFFIGGFLSRQWFAGNIQRAAYRYLTGQRLFIDKNVPPSYLRRLI